MNLNQGFCVALLIGVTGGQRVYAVDNLNAFPPADDGMVRHVLQLPEMEDETNYRVELIVDKLVTTDARNRFFFGGKIEAVIIEGFGFTRFVLAELGQMAGTLMAVDPDEPKVKRFISLGGEPQILRYNSRLSLVVYVSEGIKVRYRIWSATPETNTMEKG